MTSPATDAPYPRPADTPRPAVFILGPAATTAAGLLAATLAEPASPAFYTGTVISALALVAAWVLGGDHRVIDTARWPAHALRGSWPGSCWPRCSSPGRSPSGASRRWPPRSRSCCSTPRARRSG